MPNLENAEVVSSLAVMTLGQMIYTGCMPEIQDCLTAGKDNAQMRTRVEHGHISSAVSILVLGAALSYWAHSYYPLYASGLTIAVMSGVYQYSLEKVAF